MKLFFCKRSIRLTTVVKQFLCGHPTILSLLPPSLMTMYMHLRCWKLIKSGETMGSIHVSLQQLGDHWACHGKCWSIVCSNVPVHTANGTKYLRVFTSLSMYTCRTALLFNKPYLLLIQAKTGSSSEERRTVDTPSWSSPGTGPLVMRETETLRYCDTTAHCQ